MILLLSLAVEYQFLVVFVRLPRVWDRFVECGADLSHASALVVKGNQLVQDGIILKKPGIGI